MHELSFRLKRAHLRAVETHKPIVAEFGLTPARFDVLSVMRSMGGGGWVTSIADRLGVSRTTIRKMVIALEEQGLVWRAVDLHDARQVDVTLTKLGFETIVAALKAIVRADELRRFYEAMHPDGREFVEMAVRTVRHIARRLFDGARYAYPLDTPDEEEEEARDNAVREIVERTETAFLASLRRWEALNPTPEEPPPEVPAERWYPEEDPDWRGGYVENGPRLTDDELAEYDH
ncbi:MAG: winged helix-turn-helix transcriptional regulator [Labilithrix sp.]|nr:winged helix-turn-helix transcriptional regulator [Labilithrix sp.]